MKNLLAGVLIFISTSVFASFGGDDESEIPKETYGGLGACMPLGPTEFKDGWNTGFGGYIASGAGTKIPGYEQLFISGGSRFDFDGFSLNTTKFLSDLSDSGITGINISGGNLTMLNLAGYVKAAFDFPMVSPFISIGAGWFQLLASDMTLSDNFGTSVTVKGGKNNAFSILFTGGVTLGGKIWSFIIEPDFIIAFTKGGTTQYPSVKAGIYYRK